nr:HYR domain-containing protein [Bacteroidota bacterium]
MEYRCYNTEYFRPCSWYIHRRVTDANGCITTYITSITCSDNIAPVLSAGPGSGTPLFENFEAGVLPVGWSATGLWHVTGSCSSGTPPNPTQWAYYGIDGQCNYNNGVANSGDLTSTTVSIPGTASSAKVRFSYAYNGEGGAPPTGFDNASVRMSINGGAFVQAAALSTTGSFGTWLASEFSIPAAIGGTIALQWNFSTQDGIANATLGLQVDSVAITYIDVQQCPANIVVSNDPGVCGTTVSWTPPTASDNCAVTVTSNKNPGDFFPVGTTVVTYTATDGCGNATSCSFNVTVNLVGPPILNISDTHVDVDCQGANNGSIDLTVTSIGGGPYLYLWSNGATTQDISGLFVGVYTVNVTEANGCSATYSVSIADNPPLQVTETHTDVLCNGNTNGTIDITATDGKPAYGYLWSDGVTAEDRTGLSPGTYTVTVTDQCGTSQILTIVIGEPTALSATCSLISNVSCNGGSNGSASVVGSGGTPPYSTSPSTTGLTAGTYTFTVTDANGCTATCAATITQPTALLANTSTTAATCINTTNGSATSAPSGGTGPYTYLWSNGSTNATAINLAGGTYTVLVNDANGCTVILSATITSLSSIPAQPGAITGNVSVCLSSTGNVYSIVAVPGATSYTWSTGSTTATITSGQGSTSIQVSFSGAAVSSTISVTANNVCGSSIARFKSYKVTAALTLPGPIAGQTTGLCKKLNVPYSIASVPGALSYFWTVPAGVTIVSGQGSTAIVVNYNNAFTGTGNITVQAVNSCTMSSARLLAVSAKAAKPVIIGSNTTCMFQTGVVYSVTPVVGATSYTWTVVPGSSIVSGQGTTSIVVNWGNINGVIKCKGNNLCGSGLDGTLPVSFTCKEDGSALDISELALYPNPTDNLATLDFDAFVDGNATLIITDMVGRVVSTENFDVTEGNNKRTIDVNQFAKGTYLIKVSCEGSTRIVRLMVQ